MSQVDNNPDAGPHFFVNGCYLHEPAFPGYVRIGLVARDTYLALDVLAEVASVLGKDLVRYTAPADTEVRILYTSPATMGPTPTASPTAALSRDTIISQEAGADLPAADHAVGNRASARPPTAER